MSVDVNTLVGLLPMMERSLGQRIKSHSLTQPIPTVCPFLGTPHFTPSPGNIGGIRYPHELFRGVRTPHCVVELILPNVPGHLLRKALVRDGIVPIIILPPVEHPPSSPCCIEPDAATRVLVIIENTTTTSVRITRSSVGLFGHLFVERSHLYY